jgi:DNA modification methylase
MQADIREGDALARLREMPHGSVRTIVTSPPYWGLRDYGVAGQLGLEKTPGEFIANMVEVFRAARDVLADDGTLWLNMGDTYASTGGGGAAPGATAQVGNTRAGAVGDRAPRTPPTGLKPKDLCMMPARLAIALQDDGWYLRQDIIWNKPNPMPESVTDRCTKAHEYLFLLSKRERYYFNADAIREPIAEDTMARYERGRSDDHKWADGGPGGQTIARSFDHMKKPVAGWANDGGSHSAIDHAQERDGRDGKLLTPPTRRSGNKERKPASVRGVPEGSGKNQAGSVPWEGSTRNKRSVWTIPTEAYAEARFATFPRALVRPCILAGSEVGDTVLDPFGGSGTTVEVALAFGRRGVMIELNPKYAELARRRLSGVTLGLALEA